MVHEHHYQVTTKWLVDNNDGNQDIKTYDRTHSVSIDGKPELLLTTDNAAVGDKSKLNIKYILVTAISSCHMLSYLYVCSLEGIIVTSYIDHAKGLMLEESKGGGSFKEVVLYPEVKVKEHSMIEKAIELHHKAHEICYIANSVNFEVKCKPTITA